MGMKLWGIKSHNIIKLTTYLQLIANESQLTIVAIYGRNFKPKIFADIIIPDTKIYNPHTGKLCSQFLSA